MDFTLSEDGVTVKKKEHLDIEIIFVSIYPFRLLLKATI